MTDGHPMPAWCRIDRELAVVKVQVRDAPDAGARLAESLGLTTPAPNRFATMGTAMLAAIAPGEWLLANDSTSVGSHVSDMQTATCDDTSLILDVTHGVVALRMEGAPAAACLAAYTALDLRNAAMPTGSAVRTRIGDIGAFVARTGDAPDYLLIADQSHAPYLLDLIARNDRNPQ